MFSFIVSSSHNMHNKSSYPHLTWTESHAVYKHTIIGDKMSVHAKKPIKIILVTLTTVKYFFIIQEPSLKSSWMT